MILTCVETNTTENITSPVKLIASFGSTLSPNNIGNGIKFTNKGTISVKCSDSPTHLEFCIEDTGIGLKENEQNVIFEKFRQIDFSSTRKYEGIGLGLSIVKELVEMHSGKVWVESTFGHGSRFYFTISKKMDLTAALVT